MSNILKKQIVAELKERLNGINSCVLLQFDKMEVKQADDLRCSLRDSDVNLTVVKDSLANIAFKDMDLPVAEDFFQGPTAIAYGGAEITDAPKAVNDWIKREGVDVLTMKGGLLDGKLLDKNQVKALADIPPRPQMLSMVLAAIIAPASAVLTLSQALQVKITGLVQALGEKKEKE